MFVKTIGTAVSLLVKRGRFLSNPAVTSVLSGQIATRQSHGNNTITLTYPKGFEAGNKQEGQRIPRPQELAPEFKGQAVVNRQFKEISSKDFNGKWLILFFYPLDFTFVCPTEIVAFSDRAADFKAINCEVVACSTDSHFSHLAWISTPRKSGGLGDMNIPVLSDFNKTISRSYGVLLDGLGAALRGLFLIDPKGVVRHVNVNDLPVGRSVDEALRILQAFQYVEKHGEVCPANWKGPNDPTIKPNPTGSKEYFEKVNK